MSHLVSEFIFLTSQVMDSTRRNRFNRISKLSININNQINILFVISFYSVLILHATFRLSHPSLAIFSTCEYLLFFISRIFYLLCFSINWPYSQPLWSNWIERFVGSRMCHRLTRSNPWHLDLIFYLLMNCIRPFYYCSNVNYKSLVAIRDLQSTQCALLRIPLTRCSLIH